MHDAVGFGAGAGFTCSGPRGPLPDSRAPALARRHTRYANAPYRQAPSRRARKEGPSRESLRTQTPPRLQTQPLPRGWYERDDLHGELVLGQERANDIDLVLQDPVPLQNAKGSRKLLQMSNTQVSCYSDGRSILGLIKTNAPAGYFRIRFHSANRWTLVHTSTPLAVVTLGVPTLPLPRLSRDRFENAFRQRFDSSPNDPTWAVINAVLDGHHGALIVIADDAAQEAIRLGGQATLIVSSILDPAVAESVCRIDGAILLDPEGRCHALGTILDGTASDKGDPARGARFNSAVRYIYGSSQRRLAVVISEDGAVDLLPAL